MAGGGGFFLFKAAINVSMSWIDSRVQQPESNTKQSTLPCPSSLSRNPLSRPLLSCAALFREERPTRANVHLMNSICLPCFCCRAALHTGWRSGTAWRHWACPQQTRPSSAERCPRGNASGKSENHRRFTCDFLSASRTVAHCHCRRHVAKQQLVVSRHSVMLVAGID